MLSIACAWKKDIGPGVLISLQTILRSNKGLDLLLRGTNLTILSASPRFPFKRNRVLLLFLGDWFRLWFPTHPLSLLIHASTMPRLPLLLAQITGFLAAKLSYATDSPVALLPPLASASTSIQALPS